MEEWRDAITDPPTNDDDVLAWDIACGLCVAFYDNKHWHVIDENFPGEGIIAWMPHPEQPVNTKYAYWRSVRIPEGLELIDSTGLVRKYTLYGWKCSSCGYAHKIHNVDLPHICPQCGRQMVL